MVADAEAFEKQQPRTLLPTSFDQDFRGSFSGHERDHFFYVADAGGDRLFDAAYCFGLDLGDDGRSAVPIDVDGDGDLDLALLSLQGLHLLQNQQPRRSFARVGLRATRTQWHALGAKVRLRARGVEQLQTLALISGFQSQVSLELHFGLADATRIDSLEVEWPSGQRQRWSNLPVDRRLFLTEGEEQVGIRELPSWPRSPTPRMLASLEDAPEARRLWSPPGEPPQPLAPAGRPAVIHFWASGCAPCRTEFPSLAAVARRNGDRVHFAAVHVDATPPAREAPWDEPGFRQFQAVPELLQFLAGDAESLVLPSTLVFDAGGQLRRQYQRPVRPDELEALLASLEDEAVFLADFVRSGSLMLQRGDYPEALRILREGARLAPDDARVHYELGRTYALLGQHLLAARSFEKAVANRPDDGMALHNLGAALLALERNDEACAAFRRAVDWRGEALETLMAWGAAAVGMGDFEQAERCFARAVKAHPTDPQALYWLGLSQEARGDEQAAILTLRKACELAPESAEIAAALARLTEQ